MRYRGSHSRRLLLFTWDGIPVYADWTLPIGLLIVCGGIAFTASAFIGFIVLILAHEAGHAVLVRRYGYRVTSLLVHGFGGECEYEGDPPPWELSVIAWGGILGQAALFGVIFVPIRLGLVPPEIAHSGFVGVAGGYNFFAGFYNLLPLRHFDGEQAWRIFRLLYLRVRYRHLKRQAAREAARRVLH